uniref:Uncharacterized protein n=1 Tax=Arundo donax TaxID=35708 RepID=A0A0A9I212_ARUDO
MQPYSKAKSVAKPQNDEKDYISICCKPHVRKYAEERTMKKVICETITASHKFALIAWNCTIVTSRKLMPI